MRYVRTPDALGLAHALGREYPIAYQALTDCQLLRFGRGALDDLRRYPELGWASAELLARFLDEVLAETARVAFHSVRERVAYHLVVLAQVIEPAPPRRAHRRHTRGHPRARCCGPRGGRPGSELSAECSARSGHESGARCDQSPTKVTDTVR